MSSMKVITTEARHIPSIPLAFASGEELDLPSKVGKFLVEKGFAVEKKEVKPKAPKASKATTDGGAE